MRQFRIISFSLAVCLVVAWPAMGAPPVGAPAATEVARAVLADAAVRIDVDAGEVHGICTGWIGWSEESRSAAYTAAHCYREEARFRVTLASGETFTAFYLTRWSDTDLMALWIPKGRLRALRAWKPLPPGPFRALYPLSERGAAPRIMQVDVPGVQWEIRFENHPAAVAIPLYSAPGTSGAPLIDLADGLLLGMIVGYAINRPDVSAVVPAQQIYTVLSTATRP